LTSSRKRTNYPFQRGIGQNPKQPLTELNRATNGLEGNTLDPTGLCKSSGSVSFWSDWKYILRKKQSTFWSHKGNLLKTIIKESVLVCDLLFENYGEFRNQSVNESGFDASWTINCPTASRWSYITGPL
jgi:hypothetical protein